MQKKRVHILIALVTGLFFLLLDQFLKYQSLHDWSQTHSANKFLGWQPFLNPGVAFGIPLPNIITVIFSIFVLIILIYLVTKKSSTVSWITALILIISGALSNLIDRLMYAHTIDYLLILTGIINLADILIVLGFILFFISNYKSGSPLSRG